jgi:hypothetical protein
MGWVLGGLWTEGLFLDHLQNELGQVTDDLAALLRGELRIDLRGRMRLRTPQFQLWSLHAWVPGWVSFDTIPHDRLLERVQEQVADGRLIQLLESYLKAGVMEGLRGWEPTEQGTPQGAVISPLLANLYLSPLDHQMARQGYAMTRYADDLVIQVM